MFLGYEIFGAFVVFSALIKQHYKNKIIIIIIFFLNTV